MLTKELKQKIIPRQGMYDNVMKQFNTVADLLEEYWRLQTTN
jgi:hypothetical protein